MTDQQLGRALAHHKFVLQLPTGWWRNAKYGNCYEPCTAVASHCKKINKRFYLMCNIVSPAPAKRVAHELQFPIGSCHSFHEWPLRRFLDSRFNSPQTLEDLGLVALPGEQGVTAALAAWSYAVAARAITAEDGLESIGILEPDPKNYKTALQHPLLRPFWVESAEEEMTGLWRRGCFKRHHLSTLTPTQSKSVFRSRFHHKIKRHTKTSMLKSLKTRLVV